MASVLKNYQECYEGYHHTVHSFKIGLPLSHDSANGNVPCWKFFAINARNTPWEETEKIVNNYAAMANKLTVEWEKSNMVSKQRKKYLRSHNIPVPDDPPTASPVNKVPTNRDKQQQQQQTPPPSGSTENGQREVETPPSETKSSNTTTTGNAGETQTQQQQQQQQFRQQPQPASNTQQQQQKQVQPPKVLPPPSETVKKDAVESEKKEENPSSSSNPSSSQPQSNRNTPPPIKTEEHHTTPTPPPPTYSPIPPLPAVVTNKQSKQQHDKSSTSDSSTSLASITTKSSELKRSFTPPPLSSLCVQQSPNNDQNSNVNCNSNNAHTGEGTTTTSSNQEKVTPSIPPPVSPPLTISAAASPAPQLCGVSPAMTSCNDVETEIAYSSDFDEIEESSVEEEYIEEELDAEAKLGGSSRLGLCDSICSIIENQQHEESQQSMVRSTGSTPSCVSPTIANFVNPPPASAPSSAVASPAPSNRSTPIPPCSSFSPPPVSPSPHPAPNTSPTPVNRSATASPIMMSKEHNTTTTPIPSSDSPTPCCVNTRQRGNSNTSDVQLHTILPPNKQFNMTAPAALSPSIKCITNIASKSVGSISPSKFRPQSADRRSEMSEDEEENNMMLESFLANRSPLRSRPHFFRSSVSTSTSHSPARKPSAARPKKKGNTLNASVT
eukprot:NODE_28_length_2526_cov_334.272614_g27_i0.p1 GENE.NODE_28_length_2526_cov_334.272614_g27_i0~~NODE_28_length_2526_cov_334.272614_g27_i0.p1  ORF type:complete len:782 (-),score=250.72 NODE_28_length_2526_cov_334.272614_g27_i0:181-2181(-)